MNVNPSSLVGDQLKLQAADRRRLLEAARSLQGFQLQAKMLHHWAASTQERLLQEEEASDVTSALALLEQHRELRLEMEEQRSRWETRASSPPGSEVATLTTCPLLRWKETEELGRSLGRGSSDGTTGGVDVRSTLEKLEADWCKLDALWASRGARLEEGAELQRLNQEGDRIEAALSGHETRLRVEDVGVRGGSQPYTFVDIFTVLVMTMRVSVQDSAEGVYALLGRQDELEGLLKVLDHRVDRFAQRSRELVRRRHHAATR